MKTQFRRLTASLLALMMCLELYGGTVWADDMPTSGMCGDNVSWSFATNTGTLTISGEGEINRQLQLFSNDSGLGAVKSIDIKEGVTAISGFSECYILKSVTIAESVTSIGNWAFDDCPRLESVNFPDGLTSIGGHAFDGCASLQSISFGNKLIQIGEGAFSGCTSLTSVVLPDSVVRIDSDIGQSLPKRGAFYGCTSLTSVKLSSNLTKIPDYAFYKCKKMQSVEIPSRVRAIGKSAFSGCSTMTDLVLSEKLQTIDDFAFYSCNNLKQVTIPSSVTVIGDEAFGYVDTGSKVTKIPDFQITGYSGSAAEDYAINNGFTFNSLGSLNQETPPQVVPTTVTVPAETCEHSWDLGEIIKEPTFKEPGKITYTCEKCKKTQTWSLPVSKDHTWDAGTVTKEPTTTEEGAKTYTCTICGQTKTEAVEKIPMPEPEPTPTPEPKVTATTLSSVKYDKTSKTVTVKWSKNTTGKGYELQYSTDKKFKKSVKTVTINKSKTTKTTIKKLKKGTYYVRIRTVNGKKTSAWSKSKSVKVK